MVTFTLDGKEVQAEEGLTILQVAEANNIHIPTLCNHKALEPAGLCRICSVELFDGRRTRFVTACNYPVWRTVSYLFSGAVRRTADEVRDRMQLPGLDGHGGQDRQ
jgi:predicted molibdopterin-dependent oxidoreductase YjgC